jgi:S-adenosylmethionine synthetase
MKSDFIFISESVTEGHPDKLCDQISDAVVDGFLNDDPYARVVAECAVAKGIVFLAVRFASQAVVDVPGIARQVIHGVGYTTGSFSAKSSNVMLSLQQDAPAAAPVDERELDNAAIERIVAGNQVSAFGFACRQTPAMLPLPIWLAHKLARRLAAVRLVRRAPYLSPDGKTQIAIEYRNRHPVRVHALSLIAAAGAGQAPDSAALLRDMMELVVLPAFEDEAVRPDAETRIFVNPGGPFVVGGPEKHAGLTGRKNAIDTYGEYSRHSGAALSGKDPTRIDRIGAYAARHAAKNVVAAGLADECEVQLSYTIGLARPVSVQVETFGTGRLADDEIAGRVQRHLDFRPAAIIARFNLRQLPRLFKGRFYSRLAAYGHVGRMDIGLPWELVDAAGALRD